MLLIKNSRIQIKGNHLEIVALPDDYEFPETLSDYASTYPSHILTKEVHITKEKNDLLHVSMIEVYYEEESPNYHLGKCNHTVIIAVKNYKRKTRHKIMQLYNCSFVAHLQGDFDK